jgi:hypothetical protein
MDIAKDGRNVNAVLWLTRLFEKMHIAPAIIIAYKNIFEKPLLFFFSI